MLSSTQFFLLGIGPLSNPLNMYKLTFSSTSVDWANKIACSPWGWGSYLSESMLSQDGLTIHSFFLFRPASSSMYLYYAALSVSTGSVIGNRYKSSVSVGFVWGLASNGDYFVTTTGNPSLVIYNTYTSTFLVKSFTGFSLYGWAVEPTSGR